jgi:hypothetical protein
MTNNIKYNASPCSPYVGQIVHIFIAFIAVYGYKVAASFAKYIAVTS